MQNSVLLCISTLLESGNHYSKMFELKDSVGRQLFETISITLVCDDCLKTEHPENCTHKLAEYAAPPPTSVPVALTPLAPQDAAMAVVSQNGAFPCPVLVPAPLH